MNRFFQSVGISLLCALFTLDAAAQLRQQISLTDSWLFQSDKGELPRSWEAVTLPHTWNAVDGTTPDYYRGSARYKRQLELTAEQLRHRLFLRFEAVSQDTRVSVNGTLVGTHRGAFTAFCMEITSQVHAGGNLLEVEVTNAFDEHIAPLSGDFTLFGGIYRPVSLWLLPRTCITPLDYASPGVYIHQQEVNEQRAQLAVVTKVNSAVSRKDCRVRVSLFDAGNTRVGQVETSPQNFQKGQTATFTSRLEMDHPHLWDGLRSPYLYRAFVEVLQGKHVVDTLSQQIGLRYYQVDAKKGFYLNGHPYKIRGVNRHQDRQDKGWAISEADHRQDMQLIKEMGVNGIRLAHYPHADCFYSLCDREGMLVWAEIPLIGRITPDSLFAATTSTQLTELIRQNFNHPSIFCWSLFNELVEGKTDELVAELNALAHREDPTRLTVAAANIENRPENILTDLMAYNTYPGWYWAQPSTMGSSVAHWNRLVGSKGIGVSEYGAGANVWHHQADVSSSPRTDGIFHPEEWQAIVHEQNYSAIRDSAFVWGSFVWNMFDFASASRHEGAQLGLNDKGLVTYDRRIKKDAYYFYQSEWASTPVLHLTGQRDVVRYDSLTTVKVYTNCTEVQLTLNGKPVGNLQRDHSICRWPDVVLRKGENRLRVTGRQGEVELTDECGWVLL